MAYPSSVECYHRLCEKVGPQGSRWMPCLCEPLAHSLDSLPFVSQVPWRRSCPRWQLNLNQAQPKGGNESIKLPFILSCAFWNSAVQSAVIRGKSWCIGHQSCSCVTHTAQPRLGYCMTSWLRGSRNAIHKTQHILCAVAMCIGNQVNAIFHYFI